MKTHRRDDGRLFRSLEAEEREERINLLRRSRSRMLGHSYTAKARKPRRGRRRRRSW